MHSASRSGGRKARMLDSPAGNIKGPYIVDKSLTPRVKQYLSQFRKGYTPDIEEMTSHLQSRYSEYNRKKKNAFRSSVQKVYQAICREKSEEALLQNLEDRFLNKRRRPPSYKRFPDDDKGSEEGDQPAHSTPEVASSDSELSLGDEPLIEAQDTNMMNQSMQMMYKVSTSQHASGAEDNCEPTMVPSGEDRADKCQTPLSHLGDHASTPLQPESNSEGIADRQIRTEDQTKQDTASTSSENLSRIQTPAGVNAKRKLNDTSDKTGTPSKTARKRRKREGSSKEDVEKPSAFASTQSTVKFADIGGCAETIKQVSKLLIHMWHPEVFKTLGVTPTTGFLLHGPPGCGKTLLAHAIAGELEMPFLKLAATEIVSGVSGESEEKVRDLFASAVAQAPCVLFLDEIDSITPKRENASKDMERRIVSQLLTCMDDLNSNPSAHVLVIGATNRPDSLDPALRRAGRFDREISMGIPDENARASVLRVMCKQLKLSEDFSFTSLARQTPGYVGADLMALTREAAMIAVNRTFDGLQKDAQNNLTDSLPINHGNSEISEQNIKEENTTADELPSRERFSVMEWLKTQPPLSAERLSTLCITMDDFKGALSVVQPSAKREGFATIPDVTWADVGALQDVREELTMAILAPVQHPEEFAALGLTHPPGILLAGPPGCGKTLLAKAIANESGINFISVKGPELLNMYVGESERAVRQVFQRARNSAPCVIFFDELDSLCPRRSGSAESGASVRVVNQLLTEMDGLQARKHVFIMAATNRPDIIDPAVMRPGRLDKVLYVGLPDAHDRHDILTTLTKNGTKPLLLGDVNLAELARDQRCTGFSGADMAALVREACMAALRERISMTSQTQQTADLREHTAGALGTSDDVTVPVDHTPCFTVPAETIPGVASKTPLALDTTLRSTVTNLGAASMVLVATTAGGSATSGVPACATVGVGLRHFERAFDKVRPSVSLEDQVMYKKIKIYAAKL